MNRFVDRSRDNAVTWMDAPGSNPAVYGNGTEAYDHFDYYGIFSIYAKGSGDSKATEFIFFSINARKNNGKWEISGGTTPALPVIKTR